MPNPQSLAEKWNETLTKISNLGPMRPGSICAQEVKYQAKDGTCRANGPYRILTSKENGKTRTQRLHSDEEAQLAKTHLANYGKFRELVQDLVHIGKSRAQREMDSLNDAKKNSSKASTPNKTKKPRRCSDT